LSSRSGSGIRLWDTATGKEISQLSDVAAAGHSLCFSPNGKILAVAHGSVIKLADTTTGEIARSLHGHQGTITSIAFSQDGQLLNSTASERGFDQVSEAASWEVASGKPLDIWKERTSERHQGEQVQAGLAVGQVAS
jgi:WD40 repeat protein